MNYDSLERVLDERVASVFGEEAGAPLVYLLSAASPTDPSRRSLVEYLTTGDWPALPSCGTWTGILEKAGGDYEDVRDDVFQDEPMPEEPELTTLPMPEREAGTVREERGGGQQSGSTMSLRTRNRSRGSLLSLGGGGGRRQRGGRGGRGGGGAGRTSSSTSSLGRPGRTSSFGRGRRGLLASPGARLSRENLYEAPPSATKSEPRADTVEERSQSPPRAQSRSLFGRGSASPARRRRGSRSRAGSRDGRRESMGSIRAEIAGSASRASVAGSQVDLEASRVDVGASQADLGGSRVSLRGRPRRGLFGGRSASRERAGSVESVGAPRRRGGGQRRGGGLLGGRSRSRGRLVQSRADLTQGTAGGAEELRPATGQGRGRGRSRTRAKSQQHLEERGGEEEEEVEETQARRGTRSLPRKREPIRRSQSSWSVR